MADTKEFILNIDLMAASRRYSECDGVVVLHLNHPKPLACRPGHVRKVHIPQACVEVCVQVSNTREIRPHDHQMQTEVLHNFLCHSNVAAGQNGTPLHETWIVERESAFDRHCRGWCASGMKKGRHLPLKSIGVKKTTLDAEKKFAR
jgi:hypothetical protein